MAGKYQIWDKKSNVIVPTGKVFTPEEWIEQYPVAGIDSIDVVIAGGTINGAFFSEYSNFIQIYERQGVDFSDCDSQQACLDKIEEFEDARNNQPVGPSSEERIAAALEAQVMMSMPDVDE